MVWIIFRCAPIPVDTAITLQKWFTRFSCMMYKWQPPAKSVSFIRGYTNISATDHMNYFNFIRHGKRG